TGQTYTLSKRASEADAWTGLKASGAVGYDIPMRGVNTITSTHGTMWRSAQNTNLWLDELTYSATGITDVFGPYAITASAGPGGSIAPSGATTVAYGASRTFAITPASGYQIASVLVDGVSVGAPSTYTFSNVAANHTIAASFAAISTGGDMAVSYINCESCHAPGSPLDNHDHPCASCHAVSYAHPGTPSQIHIPADVFGCTPCHDPSLTVEHNAAGRTTSAGTPVVCDTCHGSTDPAVKAAIASNNSACSACHSQVDAGHETLHGSDVASMPLGVTGFACGDCHDPNVLIEHRKPAASSLAAGCDACHPSPRDSFADWTKTCVQGGCHVVGSATAVHGSIDASHAPLPANAGCIGAGCHADDLSAVHASAETIVDGEARHSCLVCHSTTVSPTTSDCTVCHFSMEAHPGGVHAAPASPSCAGAMCHDIVDVRTNHADAPEGACAVCHSNPTRAPVLPADSECVRCHDVQAGVPHYEVHAADPALMSGGVPNYAFYTGSAPGGFFTTACASCHTSNLVDAHIGSAATQPQKDRFGNPLTCDSCHDSTDSDVVLAIVGGLTKCDACHENPMTGGPGVHGPINPTHTSTFKASPEVPCAPCHSANVADEHNGTQSWPDANGTQLAYCDVCHQNYAGARGQQVQDAIEVTNDVRCTACHAVDHPDLGGHAATSSASVQGCGACHAPGAATIDLKAMHAGSPLGPCAVCHENPARVPDITAKTAECASCHASEGTDYHRGLPEKHVYGSMPATCLSSTCHTSNSLPQAHEPYLARYPAYTTTCALCHANTTPDRIPADATASCDSCHAPIHPNMDHTADASGECIDCHETADALTLHAGAVGGPCDVCHANPSRVPALPDSIECVNCHAYSPPATEHYPAASHEATGETDAACSKCHKLGLNPEHAKASSGPVSCVSCHETKVDAFTAPWSGTCSDQGCHATKHDDVTAAHGSTQSACAGSGCHGISDVASLHSNASTTVAGVVYSDCYVCHQGNDVVPANTDCYTCHAGHGDLTAAHTAGASQVCVDCHETPDVRTIHAGSPLGECAVCHNNPSRVPTLPSTVDCAYCHDKAPVDAKHYPAAPHLAAETGCSNCHYLDMKAEHVKPTVNVTCVQCHETEVDAFTETWDKKCITCHPVK
ncbi:MAG: hypothetical protein U1E26_11480, partial [Coriobacteriia bacterium]|nr:hypothetical protein [Coriobacteriia bacterium]